MSAMDPIVIVASPSAPIDLELVGVSYKIKQPKSMSQVSLSVLMAEAQDDPRKLRQAIDTWVRSTFSKTDSPGIMARLEDCDDALDIIHLTQLTTVLMEAVTGLPPT